MADKVKSKFLVKESFDNYCSRVMFSFDNNIQELYDKQLQVVYNLAFSHSQQDTEKFFELQESVFIGLIMTHVILYLLVTYHDTPIKLEQCNH